MLDEGVSLDAARSEGLTPEAFFLPAHRLIYHALLDLAKARQPVCLEVLVQHLINRNMLEVVGGMSNLITITGGAPTTVYAGYFIGEVRRLAALREAIKVGTAMIEGARGNAQPEELIVRARDDLARIATTAPAQTDSRPIFSYEIPPDGHASILLGKRYLNRGDSAVLVSTSGMGKSAMAIQMAIELALNRGPFGIQGNGSLSSLIVQSEDSDGDIGEVALSIKHELNLAADQIAAVDSKVFVHTERVARGPAFIKVLKALIARHRPDLVWINPLQAFIQGDVTDSKDLGEFLREQLNSLNQPPAFGYMVVHHTTKPATGKERAQRLWHEVMYDMAGGAEIINWARAIISLRAAENEGEFNLVLAKRGKRAGVTRKVPQGTGWRLEPLTTIPLKHCSGFIDVPGVAGGIAKIFWEPREVDAEAPKERPPQRQAGGRPEKYSFEDYANVFPKHTSDGLPISVLQRTLSPNKPISQGVLHNCLKRWAEQGHVEIIAEEGRPMVYRKALGAG